jgi:hypothetical protein
MAEKKNIEIDFSYYYSLFKFDSRYYKLYDQYIYDNEKHVLDLYNGNISPKDFNLDNKKYHYQILGDYEKYFHDNTEKSLNYYDKAIEAGNKVCIIKKIISKYKKGTKLYYDNLFDVLPNNTLALEYIINYFITTKRNGSKNEIDEEAIDYYSKKLMNYLKSFQPETIEDKQNYYFALSQYYYHTKEYDNFVKYSKLGAIEGSALTLCNFISYYYYTDKKLVHESIRLYLNKYDNNISPKQQIINSLLYVNLFIIYKIENKFDLAIKYLIKSINNYNKNKYNDISYIIKNTEYNSMLDILFDNFEQIKLNSTYLYIIDFKLVNYLVYYYYKKHIIDKVPCNPEIIDNIKFNYLFIQFYRQKIDEVINIINEQLSVNMSNMSNTTNINDNDLDIDFTSFDLTKFNIRFKQLKIIDYINEIVYYNSEYSDNISDNMVNLILNIKNITFDTINQSTNDCMICYEKFDYLISTYCKHEMCLKCISSVLNTSNNDNCPYCRQHMFQY